MKITAVIRSCTRDDKPAHLCYLTMRKLNIANEIIFFHDEQPPIPVEGVESETQDYPLIKSTGAKIIIRKGSDNFGGLSNVLIMIREMRKLPVINDDDYIMICDSDILFYKNPFDIMPEGADHAGIFGEELICGKTIHISGQLNILKGWLFNQYVRDGETGIYDSYYESIECDYPVADDSLLSIYSFKNTDKHFSFFNMDLWLHQKVDNSQYKMILKTL